MPNPFYTNKQFYFNLFSLAQVQSLVLFDPLIGTCHVLPLWVRVDLGAMAMKGYNAFPNLQHYWNLTIILFRVISRILIVRWWGTYPFAEKQSVYSTAPVHWARKNSVDRMGNYFDKISDISSHSWIVPFRSTLSHTRERERERERE